MSDKLSEESSDFWATDRGRLVDDLLIPSETGVIAVLAAASLICFLAVSVFAASAGDRSATANTSNYRSWVRSELPADARMTEGANAASVPPRKG
jgi:hypothetical protein